MCIRDRAVLPIDKPDMHVYTQSMPIGVVVAIVPWNAQMFLAATKIAPALAAGCTIVVKPRKLHLHRCWNLQS